MLRNLFLMLRLAKNIAKAAFITFFTLIFLSGCDDYYYYYQLAQGQLSIIQDRESVRSVINDPETDPELVEKLALSQSARTFAEDELDLPVGDNYLYYADVGRRFVVYNIYAVPELSLDPVTWCFQIIGCVSYRGYFSRSAALDYAESYQERGYDTSVGGVRAYSTLGLINDPLLNTFIFANDAELLALIFHEIAHKILFAADDTTFNESFATLVEIEGLKRWIAVKGEPDDYQNYLLTQTFREGRTQMLLETADDLRLIYQSDDFSKSEKRTAKAATIEQFILDYEAYAEDWQDQGINTNLSNINNALFARIESYNRLVPKFQEVLDYLNSDLTDFYNVCQILADFDKSTRQSLMEADAATIVAATGFQAPTDSTRVNAMNNLLDEPTTNQTIYSRPEL